MTYAETPLGSALARLPVGACCAVGTVLECPACQRVYPDDRRPEDDPGQCGPCEHVATWTYQRQPGRLRRRERRPGDRLGLAYRV